MSWCARVHRSILTSDSNPGIRTRPGSPVESPRSLQRSGGTSRPGPPATASGSEGERGAGDRVAKGVAGRCEEREHHEAGTDDDEIAPEQLRLGLLLHRIVDFPEAVEVRRRDDGERGDHQRADVGPDAYRD